MRIATILLALLLASTPLAVGVSLDVEGDPLSLALQRYDDKVPDEFLDWVPQTLDDGSMRVIVSLAQRTPATEAWLASVMGPHLFMGSSVHAIGLVDFAAVPALLQSPLVTFVEPDHRLTHFMSESTLATGARSLGAAGSGVWSYDGATGTIVSDHPAFAEPVTGAGVTVSIVDSGIDRTHRDFNGWDCEPMPYQPCDSRILFAGKSQSVIQSFFGGTAPETVQRTLTTLYPEAFAPTTEAASGHGTHVAGTIGGNGYYGRDGGEDAGRYGADGINFGTAPEVSLVSISNGDTLWAGLGSGALIWTADHVDEFGIKVSSNSWGCLGGCSYSPGSSASAAVRDLYNQGVVVTFAVGNDGGNSGGASFSGYAQSPYVLGVANYNHHTNQLAPSSSRGNAANDDLPNVATWDPDAEAATVPQQGYRRPDLAAPGTDIWSARTLTGGAASLVPRVTTQDAVGGGANGIVPYAIMSGTSMATPHVAGAAALLFDACPEASSLDVMRALMASADPSTIAGNLQGFQQGYGALDVRGALDWMLANTDCGTGPVDSDGDGINDTVDNCPAVANADQADVDGDGIGDACDDDDTDGPLGDSDGDGVLNKDDVCQGHDDGLDNDGDGIPNGCDPTPNGTSGSSATYYFDRGDLLTGNAGNVNGVLYGMLQLKEETPTWSDPAVMHVSYLDGTGGGHNVLYDAGAWGGAPAFDGGDVTITWWMANPVTGPGFFETFELKVLCGGTSIKTLAHTGPSGTGGLPSRYEATLTGVPACAGDVGVLIDPQGLLGDPGQPFTNVDYFLFYDAVGYPSSATFTTVISNVAPTADAGEDQSVDEEDSVGLNGTASSDSDGSIMGYSWQQTAGPSVTLTGADTATPSFMAPMVDADTDLVFRLTVTDDGGATGTDSVTVSVRDTFYLAPDVQITNPTDGETIDAEGGLSVAGDFDPAARFPVEGTQSLPLDLATGWEDPDQGGNGDYVFIDAPGAGTVVEGDTTLVGRAGNSPTDPNGCQTDCCETGCEFDFGEPQADDIRPGDLSQGCTLNFIFEDEGRYFFGSAAHCAATGSNTDTNGCTTAPQAIGSSQTLRARGGHTITTKLAYSSWGTMQAHGESNDNACFGNDFALFEIDPADLDKVHPSVRMYGGPTGLGAISDMVFMDDIRGYGRSSLHDDYIVRDPDESLTNPKNGYYLGSSNGGWSYWVYLLPQGIPGDSGGGIMDIHGNALGAASTISALGASNNYANIARALDYMRQKEGWAPTLVTWDEFDPDPRVSMVTGDSSSSQVLPDGVLGEDAGHSHMLAEGRPVPDLTIVGGAVGEVGAPVFSNTDTHLIVSLPLEGDFDGAIPSSSGTPISYEVGFRTDHNGVALDHRLTYEWSSYDWRDVLAGNLEEEPFTDAFGVFVETAADAVGSFICPIATDLSGSTYDIETSTVHWAIPLTAFDQANKPAGNSCASFARTGEPLTAGDTLTGIVSGAVLTTVNVNWGSAFGLFTGPTADDYTLAGCDCGPVVIFTVNGQDAGSANVTADAWNHTIDFSGFTPDGLGQYVVVATFGTANETVVYHAPGGDPCARVQSKIVITLGDHTACTEYDPSMAGTWGADFDDISDLTPGAYALTATAYDDAGAVLDSHTITVHVADPDSDGDGVADGADNCVDVHNPDQADLDGDGQGDACDDQDNRDSDGDGVENWQDACPGHDDHADLDGDGTPDGCDDDRDGDGFTNDEEGRAGTDQDDAGSKPPGPTCDHFAGHPGGPPHCRD